MPTFLWVMYDIALGIVGFFFLDRSLTKKEWSVVIGLLLVGIVIAVYSGYSDIEADALIVSLKQGRAYNTGQFGYDY
jgi:RsiW-degrading membrane proteinase PrsW (M82 family)